jgi:hypothetical protein
MTWKLSPHSLLWPTSAPGLPRAGHGNRHHRPGFPRRVARVPSLRTAKIRKKKNHDSERPPSAALVVAATTGGRNERNKRPRPQRSNSGSCPVHPNSRHSATECREIIELAKRVSERHEQTSKDGSPPRCRPGKERVDSCRCFGSDRAPRVAPRGAFWSRTVLPTVARWFALDARETVDNFVQVRAALRCVIPYVLA